MADGAEKRNFGGVVLEFVFKIRFLVIGLLAAGVLAVIAVGVYSAVDTAAKKGSAGMIDSIEKRCAALADEPNPEKKAEEKKAIGAEAEALAKKYPGRPASQRGFMALAKLSVDAEDFAAAEKDYLRAADLKKKSYLTPVALMDAAVMAERAGRADDALKHVERVIQDYADFSSGLSYVYFTAGRLNESKKAYDKAVELYKKMEELYPGDNWTNLAKSRIISLKSQGLVP
jgi:predicted negative regulator of RcsB-dependent stress response